MTDLSGIVMRKLTASDIPQAMELSAEAGWNQTAEDWDTLIKLSPEGCMAIEADGELAATATLMCYGKRLAWIGMVLTRIRYRGRGFARRLMTQALALADEMQIETVKLDATDQGQPLYEKLGFRCEQAIERWWRGGVSRSELGSEVAQQTEDFRAADLRAFGADRSELLLNLARGNPPLWFENAFLFTRPGRVTSYLGPCVSDTARSARTLMERALQTHIAGEWYWDLLIANEEALALARALDFTPKRHLTRMVRGKELRADEKKIYAIAGFELG